MKFLKMTYYFGKKENDCFVLKVSYNKKINKFLLSLIHDKFNYETELIINDYVLNRKQICFNQNIFNNDMLVFKDSMLEIKVFFNTKKQYGVIKDGSIKYNNLFLKIIDYKYFIDSSFTVENNYIINFGYGNNYYPGIYFLKVNNINKESSNVLFLYENHGKIKQVKALGKIKYRIIDNKLSYYVIKINTFFDYLIFENKITLESIMKENMDSISEIISFVSFKNEVYIEVRNEKNNISFKTNNNYAINERILNQ